MSETFFLLWLKAIAWRVEEVTWRSLAGRLSDTHILMEENKLLLYFKHDSTDVHYRVHRRSPVVPTLSQTNLVNNLPPYFLKIHFDIMLNPTSVPPILNALLIRLADHLSPLPCATSPVRLILLDVVTRTKFCED
jgi:hypothetical protein